MTRPTSRSPAASRWPATKPKPKNCWPNFLDSVLARKIHLSCVNLHRFERIFKFCFEIFSRNSISILVAKQKFCIYRVSWENFFRRIGELTSLSSISVHTMMGLTIFFRKEFNIEYIFCDFSRIDSDIFRFYRFFCRVI